MRRVSICSSRVTVLCRIEPSASWRKAVLRCVFISPRCDTGIKDLSVSNLFWCTMATEFLFEFSLLCRRIQWNAATVEISWWVKKQKKNWEVGIFFFFKVDVIEVSVKEQNWNQRVAFKWKTASQSSLRERQHLQRFCCSLVLPLSQFLLSEPPHAHYFCPIWVRIPAVPACPRWHQWSFVWPMVHLIHNFIDQFTFMRLDVRCEHYSPCFQAKKKAPVDWGEGWRATSCGQKWQCNA